MSNTSGTKVASLPNGEMAASNFVSGLTQPDTHGPISALALDNFAAVRTGHPPPGTLPDAILPEGVDNPRLFTSVTLPFVEQRYKNRVIVSPMCQYSANNGMPSPYHIAHLGSFALHGVGNIMVEASGVVPEGRITPQCLGIWSEAHRDAHRALVASLKSFTDGLAVGIQLAHAGRKASTWSPFHRGDKKFKNYVTEAEGGWPERVVGPSAIAYDEGHITPKALTVDEIRELQARFLQSARWAFEAGYDYVELHGAHGYLFHNFLSPLSNQRTDEYGGSFEGRTKFLVDTARQIRAEFPDKGLWVRISSTDFADEAGKGDSWTVDQSVRLALILNDLHVDLIDVSGGGLVPFQKINVGPGYQLFGARAIRNALVEKAGSGGGAGREEAKRMLVGAVGMMEGSPDADNAHDPSVTGTLAEKSLREGDSDVILLARGMMANPKWAEDAAVALTGIRCAGNPQYHRVHPAKRPQH
ncbi:related to flavin oxidoreductase [Pseudozyma flocculosa]|uniref:Related to flavin oxidoreductase n=2 Tax=Pseudozyma flocculosa TaxID=84751 RepID=A0A5C3ES73_9BASI|nr:related to flavin oxidoreductase [Pseudozyma flocculosa]